MMCTSEAETLFSEMNVARLWTFKSSLCDKSVDTITVLDGEPRRILEDLASF